MFNENNILNLPYYSVPFTINPQDLSENAPTGLGCEKAHVLYKLTGCVLLSTAVP
jgi:hypothetical protein